MGLVLPLRRFIDFSMADLEVFRPPVRVREPKLAHPHLSCSQAPLQSITTAASLSTSVP